MQGRRIVSRHFRCAVCGLTYHTDTTEAEMNRELLNSGMTSGAALLSACDTCYEQAMNFSRREP
jgi:hypothetical protein